MSVSKTTVTALTKLTPQVLKTPYYEFFDLFSGERPEGHKIDNKNNLSIKKIFDEYYIHCWDHCEHKEWKNKKTKLKKIVGSLCAKLDGVFWDYSAVGISNVNWAELDLFTAGLRYWKNIDEHKVRWAVYRIVPDVSRARYGTSAIHIEPTCGDHEHCKSSAYSVRRRRNSLRK